MDSGNLLRDGITGLPVVVCSQQALSPLLPRMYPGMLPEGFRYLSVRTAAGGALMPCFRPEGVRLLGNGGWIPVEAVVGLTVDGYSGFQALVPAALTRERAFPYRHPPPQACPAGKACKIKIKSTLSAAMPRDSAKKQGGNSMALTFRLYALARKRLEEMLQNLSSQELYYIGVPDPLPSPLSHEEELALVADCRG